MLHRHGSWNQRRDQLLQPPETPWTSLGLRIPSDEGGKPSQEHPRSESECLSLCDSRKVIETSDERGKSSFDSIIYGKNFVRPKNYFNCNNGRKDLV